MRFNPLKPNKPAKPTRPTPLAKGTIPTPVPVSRTPTLKENDVRDGFEIHFPTKPDDATLALFRATKDLPADQRWHWHFRGHFWYARRNDLNRAFAARIIGAAVPPASLPSTRSQISNLKSEIPATPPTNIVPVQFTPPASVTAAPVVNTAALPPWRARLFRQTGGNA